MVNRSKTSSGVYRSRESHFGKTPEARERQLANLKNRHKKPKDPNAPPRPKKADLKDCDIITFAIEYLSVSFEERPAQEVILRSLYGLPLSIEQIEIYRKLTTNDEVFEHNAEKSEADLAVGARGGKSFLVSIITLFESIVKADHWRKYLRKDEIGYAVITATRQRQCEDIIQASCTDLLANSSLSYYIADDLTSELKLTNGLSIVSMPCNSTAARGLPIFLLIFDEIAHYRTEGVKADYKIHNALRPRQAQFPGAKCLKITTPSAKQGLFWDEFDEGFRVPGRLTIQAGTRTVNPLIPQEFIDKEYKRDPDNAAREYGANFAETVSGFFASCIDKLNDCFGELLDDFPYQDGQKYFGSIDQSGLAGRDQFAFAIAHRDSKTEKVIEDVLRTWNTKDSDLILEEIKQLCVVYKLSTVSIDRYASGWVQTAFEKKGLTVTIREKLPVIYTNFKTLAISGRLMLPDYPILRKGLMQTQAYYSKSNSLSIGHERTLEGHGDSADASVAAIFEASKNYTVGELSRDYDSEDSGPTGYDHNPLNFGLIKSSAYAHNSLNFSRRNRYW